MEKETLHNHRTRVFIIRPDGKFLIMIRNFKKLIGESYPVLMLPGGGVDEDEHPDESLLREVDEELGIKINHLKFSYKFKITRPADEVEIKYFPGVNTLNNEFDFYTATISSNLKVKILEPDKFDAAEWVNKDELTEVAKKHKVVIIGEGIEEAIKQIDIFNQEQKTNIKPPQSKLIHSLESIQIKSKLFTW